MSLGTTVDATVVGLPDLLFRSIVADYWSEWSRDDPKSGRVWIEVDWDRRIVLYGFESKAGHGRLEVTVGPASPTTSRVVEEAQVRPRGLWRLASPLLRSAARREEDRDAERLADRARRAADAVVAAEDVPIELGGPHCAGRVKWSR